MAAAAKKLSQVATHMAIAFIVTYGITGSVVFGGLAIIIEAVINVLLLPIHEKVWARIGMSPDLAPRRFMVFAAEKVSQVGMHAGIAFAVMYWATGSAAMGGLAALLEPVCNVLLLPLHDRAWESMRSNQFSCYSGSAAQASRIAASAHV